MSQCDALVVDVSDTEVWVEVSGRVASCGSCKSAGACQGSVLGTGAETRRYRLENSIGARVGDRVQLTVTDGTLWRTSVTSYVWPALLAVGGAAIGQSLAGDILAVPGSLLGLACGLALLRTKEILARRDGSLLSVRAQPTEIRFKEQS